MSDILLFITFILSLGLVLGCIYFYFFLKRLETSILNVHKRIDGIFTIDKPAPNEATKTNNEMVELSEDNVYDVPPNVKFEIEGGVGTQAPPEYEIKK